LVSAVHRTPSIRSLRSTPSVVALNDPNGGRKTTGLGTPIDVSSRAKPEISRRWPAALRPASAGWVMV